MSIASALLHGVSKEMVRTAAFQVLAASQMAAFG
jgi:hypothetical protein